MRSDDRLERELAATIPRVYAYVAYRIGPGADAEDITSETIERALRYRTTYDGGRGGVLPWALGISRRCLADARATASPSPLPDGDLLPAPSVDHDAHIDVRNAVSSLPPRDAELIALRFGADLRTRDIARILDSTPGAIDTALHRALARLRPLLDTTTRPASVHHRRAQPEA